MTSRLPIAIVIAGAGLWPASACSLLFTQDGPDRDSSVDTDNDGLPDWNDPCPDAPNALVYAGFADWEAAFGQLLWNVSEDDEAAFADGPIAMVRSPACSTHECPSRYLMDVVVHFSSNPPTEVWVQGSISGEVLAPETTPGTRCGVLPEADPPEHTLVQLAGLQYAASDWLSEPAPDEFALRLIVSREDSWCVLDEREPLESQGTDSVGGRFALWVIDGYARFERLRVWSIPAECDPKPAPPPPI